MAAYSERAGREEERDIKEREATAEEEEAGGGGGEGGLLKFTAIFITALVNQVRFLSKCITSERGAAI